MVAPKMKDDFLVLLKIAASYTYGPEKKIERGGYWSNQLIER